MWVQSSSVHRFFLGLAHLEFPEANWIVTVGVHVFIMKSQGIMTITLKFHRCWQILY